MLSAIRQRLRVALLVVGFVCATPTLAEEPVGTLGTVGSDTMAGLMLRWGEQLARQHPACACNSRPAARPARRRH